MTSVLVVDDAETTRERLCALFEECSGTETVGCAALRDVVARRFAEVEPECVVIDVPVHGGEGFELLDLLRGLSRSCLLIVLTNQVGEELERRCAGAGADHFLSKTKELERAVELVCALSEEA